MADEVRKLAEKTGKATEEITDMIKQIQLDTEESVHGMEKNRVEAEEGVSLAQQAKTSLEQIVSASDMCLDQVRSIATATEQQSAAIEEVSTGSENIVRTFEMSRDAISQMNGTTDELANVASELTALVSWFKIDTHKHAGLRAESEGTVIQQNNIDHNMT